MEIHHGILDEDRNIIDETFWGYIGDNTDENLARWTQDPQ